MRVTNPMEQRFLKALIYGPAGHGKTHFLGTAQQDPRTSPMLVLDFEGGTQTLAGLDIDVAKIRSWDDYSEVFNDLVEGSKYKSLGIDSISETHVFSLLNILDEEGSGRKDPNLLQQGDYGKATVLMRRLLRSFRDLPLHVIFTAHAKDDVDPREGQVKKPALAGQMAEEVSGMMDVVAYMALATNAETGEAERALLLKNFPKFRVKVRTGWNVDVDDVLYNPSVTSLMDALHFPVVKPGKEEKKEAVPA